jgi:hypothetical protein
MNPPPEDFLNNYESALASQNWETVSPLIHEEACVTFSDGSRYVGKTEVKQAFERNFDLIQNEEYRISNVRWIRKRAEFAVCIYDFSWQGIIQGESSKGLGRGTMVVSYEDGHWWLITEHLGPKV